MQLKNQLMVHSSQSGRRRVLLGEGDWTGATFSCSHPIVLSDISRNSASRGIKAVIPANLEVKLPKAVTDSCLQVIFFSDSVLSATVQQKDSAGEFAGSMLGSDIKAIETERSLERHESLILILNRLLLNGICKPKKSAKKEIVKGVYVLSCCPTNLARLLPGLEPSYIAIKNLLANKFGNRVKIEDGWIEIDLAADTLLFPENLIGDLSVLGYFQALYQRDDLYPGCVPNFLSDHKNSLN